MDLVGSVTTWNFCLLPIAFGTACLISKLTYNSCLIGSQYGKFEMDHVELQHEPADYIVYHSGDCHSKLCI
jgi:hypothetical protein